MQKSDILVHFVEFFLLRQTASKVRQRRHFYVLKIKYLFGLAITSNIYVNQKQELFKNTSLHRAETIWESKQKVVFDSSPPLGFGKRE